MSTFDPELADLEDPGVKLAIKGGRAGGTITGSPGGVGTLGGGGGSLSSLSGGLAGAGADANAIRALLRKRMLTTSQAPPYMSAMAPAPVAATAPAPAGSSMSSLFDMASGRFKRPGGIPGSLPSIQPQVPGGQTATPPPPGGSTWGDINQSGSGVPGDVNFGSGFFGTLNDILRNYLGSGAYSDKVNPAIMEGVRRNALSDAEASRSHNALMAQALGTDPATAASYALRSDLSSQGGVAKSMADASLGELTHQRDYGQNLLMALLGGQGSQNTAKGGSTALDQLLKIYNAMPKGVPIP